MASHLGNADPYGTTGVKGGPMLLVAGSRDHSVWRADLEFTKARAGGGDRDTDGGGVGGLSSGASRSIFFASVT